MMHRKQFDDNSLPSEGVYSRERMKKQKKGRIARMCDGRDMFDGRDMWWWFGSKKKKKKDKFFFKNVGSINRPSRGIWKQSIVKRLIDDLRGRRSKWIERQERIAERKMIISNAGRGRWSKENFEITGPEMNRKARREKKIWHQDDDGAVR